MPICVAWLSHSKRKLTCQHSGAPEISQEAVRFGSQVRSGLGAASYVDALGYLTLTLQPTVALRDETGQPLKRRSLSAESRRGILAKDITIRLFERVRRSGALL